MPERINLTVLPKEGPFHDTPLSVISLDVKIIGLIGEGLPLDFLMQVANQPSFAALAY
jgi:hypothetical protein